MIHNVYQLLYQEYTGPLVTDAIAVVDSFVNIQQTDIFDLNELLYQEIANEVYDDEFILVQQNDTFDNITELLYQDLTWDIPADVIIDDSAMPDTFGSKFVDLFDEQEKDISDHTFIVPGGMIAELPTELESVNEIYFKSPSMRLGQVITRGGYVGTGHSILGDLFAPVVNRIYYVPFYVPYTILIKELGVLVTTIGSNQARVGIYSHDRDMGKPSILIYNNLIELGSIGFKATKANVSLERALYWMAFITNSTNVLIASIVSDLTVLGVINPTDTERALGYIENGLWASGLPNMAGTVIPTKLQCPYVRCRLA